MFVGEAPGADEDEQGLAFVGRAGQLLTDIIEKGLKIPRRDVFIANVLKCRPPQNRNPEPDEILSCQPFLERADRAHPAEGAGGARQVRARSGSSSRWSPSRASAAASGITTASRSCRPSIPPTSSGTPAAKKDVWEDMKVVRRLLAEDEP